MYIPIILGTAREGRQSEKVAQYIFKQVLKYKNIETEILDVYDYHVHATDNTEEIEVAQKWKEKVVRAVAYIIISPEYNHGYPGELKIALDLVYGEYDKKPVGICGVSSGPAGGVRVVEQLRLVAIALRMVPINSAVYFPNINELFNESGDINDSAYDKRVEKFLEELIWYAKALRRARQDK